MALELHLICCYKILQAYGMKGPISVPTVFKNTEKPKTSIEVNHELFKIIYKRMGSYSHYRTGRSYASSNVRAEGQFMDPTLS